MDHIELLAESVIKLEEIKQEPDDSDPGAVWNSQELTEDSLKSEVKEDDNEELEPPVAIFLEEDIEEEVEWEEKEEVTIINELGHEEDFNVGFEGKNGNSETTGIPKNVEPANNENFEGQVWIQVFQNVVTNAGPVSLVPHKPFCCPECLSCFTQMAHLQRHMRAHTDERQHQCTVCKRAFRERYQLVTHQYIHSGQWPYRCPLCHKGFAFFARLRQHMLDRHEDEPFNGEDLERVVREKPTAVSTCSCPRGGAGGEGAAGPRPWCAKCGYADGSATQPASLEAADQSARLSAPRLLDALEQRFRCTVCPRAFSQRPSLDKHMSTHSQGRRYECSVCQQRFKRREHLDRHTRIHTGERPFCCSVCDKSFIQKDGLVRHMRTHSGEKPHACPVCAEAFSQKGTLVLHMRTHTGEKPHACPVCGKRFADPSTLTTHLRTHSGERPFVCSECPRSFNVKGHLRRHLRMMHAHAPAGGDSSEGTSSWSP